jgi:hypothetical protein
MTTEILDTDAVQKPNRCVMLIDEALPKGKATNAAAVMALTMGQRQPHLVGAPLIDAAGNEHPGLIPIGIAVLGTPASDLPALRQKAMSDDLEVVDFPVQGQQTTDYQQFRSMMAATDAGQVGYLGVMIYGDRKKVGRIVGKYKLLNDAVRVSGA